MGSESIIAWILLGVLGVVALIALIVGAAKSYTGIKPNGLAWVLACGLYLILVKTLIESKVLASLPIFANATESVTNFIVAVIVLTVVAFLFVGIFALVAASLKKSYAKAVKKAEDIKFREAEGEEIVIDENKAYKPLPIDGKKKPRIINRVFGALTAVVNATAFTAAIIAIAMLVLYVTPLSQTGIIAEIYTVGTLAKVWAFVHQYTLDFLIISFTLYMIRKGWEIGFLEGIRKLIAFAGYLAVTVGPFVLMFLPLTAEGAPLEFLGKFGAVFGGMFVQISGGAMPTAIALIIGKIIVAVLLLVVGVLLMVALNWLMKKLVDLIDDVKILSAVEKSLATVIFVVFAVSVVAVIVAVLCTLAYYHVFDFGVFYTENSPLTSGFFGAMNEWLSPLLAQIGEMLTKA